MGLKFLSANKNEPVKIHYRLIPVNWDKNDDKEPDPIKVKVKKYGE